jgi:hypothetical protein
MPKKGHAEEQIVGVLRQGRRERGWRRSVARWGLASDLLSLEVAIFRSGSERAAAVARREWSGEPAHCGSGCDLLLSMASD